MGTCIYLIFNSDLGFTIPALFSINRVNIQIYGIGKIRMTIHPQSDYFVTIT